MLVVLGWIADYQDKNNDTTTQAIKQLLDYCCNHPDYTILYKERDMVLCVHSDRSYLLESHNRSQAGEYLFLGSQNFDQSDNNGDILTISKMIKNVMTSVSKADGILPAKGEKS